MNLIELNRALRQLRLGGIAAVLETRLHQAQTEAIPPIDCKSQTKHIFDCGCAASVLSVVTLDQVR